MYLAPKKRYSFWTPRRLLSESALARSKSGHSHIKGGLGVRSSPFVSMWHLGACAEPKHDNEKVIFCKKAADLPRVFRDLDWEVSGDGPPPRKAPSGGGGKQHGSRGSGKYGGSTGAGENPGTNTFSSQSDRAAYFAKKGKKFGGFSKKKAKD